MFVGIVTAWRFLLKESCEKVPNAKDASLCLNTRLLQVDIIKRWKEAKPFMVEI